MNGVEALLYDPTGVTLMAVLDKARGITWQDELSKPGNATFELPVDDPMTALVTDRRIVKFRWRDEVRFGCIVSSEKATLTTDAGRMWVRYESQPGVASILGRSVVMPEYGLTRKSGDDRLFGFMSKVGTGPTSWYVADEWTAPVGSVVWKNDESNRQGYPPVFKSVDKNASWIAPAPGPATNVAGGTVAYYRDTFTVTSAIPVSIYVAADNFVTVYLDGEVVLEPDYTKALGWTTAQSVQVTIDPGPHILAARVEAATGGGPTAFIATTVFLSDTGKPGEARQSETLEGDVLFAVDSDDLTEAAEDVLDGIIARMRDAPTVTVVGHADSTGSTSYNQTLSEHRANAVAAYILGHTSGAVIHASGRGETEPVASNETSAGRAKNRRVVITYTFATEATTTPGDTQTITVVRRTDARWKVHAASPAPGWFRASVLRRLFLEAQARDVAGFDGLDIDYDDELDSSGRAWEIRGEYAFPIATVSLLEIAMQLAEAQMDWGVDPDTMTLRAWVRRGEDRSVGAEPVALWVGASLKAFETTRTGARVTTVTSHLADGAWLETRDAAGFRSVGRIEVGVSLGSTLVPATAREVAKSMLAESAVPSITVTGETSTLDGPLPYVQFGLGDTISVPGHRGMGRIKARVMAISVDATGDIVRAYPELVIDRSSSIGLDGPGDSVYMLYATDDGQLTTSLAPPGARSIKPMFADGDDTWEMRVGSAQQISLISSSADGVYSADVPLIVPTDNPGTLLAVWVEDGNLITEERDA